MLSCTVRSFIVGVQFLNLLQPLFRRRFLGQGKVNYQLRQLGWNQLFNQKVMFTPELEMLSHLITITNYFQQVDYFYSQAVTQLIKAQLLLFLFSKLVVFVVLTQTRPTSFKKLQDFMLEPKRFRIDLWPKQRSQRVDLKGSYWFQVLKEFRLEALSLQGSILEILYVYQLRLGFTILSLCVVQPCSPHQRCQGLSYRLLFWLKGYSQFYQLYQAFQRPFYGLHLQLRLL